METIHLIHRFVASLSPGKRVLMVGNDFELLQGLAMTSLAELVVYDRDADPNAPKADTPLGAPLRFRPDWKERPRSKDLIIDLDGRMPKAELNRILKKAGYYVSVKKRRLEDFANISLEAGQVSAHHIGDPNTTPTLDWQIEDPTAGLRRTVAWVFGRQLDTLPSIVAIHQLSASRSDDDQKLIEAMTEKLESTTEALRLATVESERSRALVREHEAEGRKLQSLLTAAENANVQTEEACEALKRDKLALEQENDELSARAASLQAEENRFARLEERFQHYQVESQKEIETLQTELRNLAAPADDVSHLAKERDTAKAELSHLVSAISDLFENTLSTKKTPKLPPIASSTNKAPLKLWFARMEALLTDQQSRLAQQSTELKAMRIQLRKAEKAAQRSSVPKLSTEGKVKTVRIDLTTPTTDESKSKLQEMLTLEQQLRADAEARLAMTIKRTQVMAKLYGVSQAEIGSLSDSVIQERSLRLGAEADRDLLKRELDAKHEELEERGRILDTYASLQSLLSDSLTQAEEARLESEDARRLADENLRILRDEFERFQQANLEMSNP